MRYAAGRFVVASIGAGARHPFTDQLWQEDVVPPLMVWVPSIGFSGLALYTGDRLPAWKDDVRNRDLRHGRHDLLCVVAGGDPGEILRIEPGLAATSSGSDG